jgi:nucleoside-diphosphate-sugar epimerase
MLLVTGGADSIGSNVVVAPRQGARDVVACDLLGQLPLRP